MELGPVTKLDMRNNIKKLWRWRHVGKSWRHCHFFNFMANLEQSGSRILDAVCKSYVFINSNILSYKNWKQNSKISNTFFTLLLWLKVLFLPKNAAFLQKNADISKIKGALVLTDIFSGTTYVCVLTCQILSF